MIYVLRTRVIPSIWSEHRRWYPYDIKHGTHQNRNNKVIPKDVELTLIKVLFWYIGDGTYHKEHKTARFTNSLVLEDAEMLRDKLCVVLDVNDGIVVNKRGRDSRGNQVYMICLNRVVTNKFFGMVDSLGFDIPDCYQYKFGR